MQICPSRRQILCGSITAALLPTAGLGQLLPGDETMSLWPGTVPGDRARPIVRRVNDLWRGSGPHDRLVTGIAQPALVVRRPIRPNRAAVLVVPGGGYEFLSYDNEGVEQAAWLNARGITAFILLYRLPGEGWDKRELVPLQDAQRAIRLIRARAGQFAVDPARVAVLGFSAGGHLAGSLATRHAERVYAPVDDADALSARPDLAGLLYPVVSMEAPFSHGGSRDSLLGADAPLALRHAASVEARVSADTSPCFIVQAGDDGLVPVANSLAMYAALNAYRRPAELHVFEEGGHGFGARLPRSMPASVWPDLFHAYGVRKGVFLAQE